MVVPVFWVLASIAIVSAFLCVTRKSPVVSALWLVQTMFTLAAMYVVLDAHFIAAIQIMVYAGAIMVLFLFVIMLLNLGREQATDMRGWTGRLVSAVVAGVLIFELWIVQRMLPEAALRLPAGELDRLTAQRGAVQLVAEPLYQNYLVPFEATAVLLLAATVGAVVIAKRKL